MDGAARYASGWTARLFICARVWGREEGGKKGLLGLELDGGVDVTDCVRC